MFCWWPFKWCTENVTGKLVNSRTVRITDVQSCNEATVECQLIPLSLYCDLCWHTGLLFHGLVNVCSLFQWEANLYMQICLAQTSSRGKMQNHAHIPFTFHPSTLKKKKAKYNVSCFRSELSIVEVEVWVFVAVCVCPWPGCCWSWLALRWPRKPVCSSQGITPSPGSFLSTTQSRPSPPYQTWETVKSKSFWRNYALADN